jgi:toxin ParE1/3/4
VIAQPAQDELQEAAALYSQKATSALGLAFVAEFERVAQLVLSNPLMGAMYRGAQRRYHFRRFPYSIIYQVTTDELRIHCRCASAQASGVLGLARIAHDDPQTPSQTKPGFPLTPLSVGIAGRIGFTVLALRR